MKQTLGWRANLSILLLKAYQDGANFHTSVAWHHQVMSWDVWWGAIVSWTLDLCCWDICLKSSYKQSESRSWWVEWCALILVKLSIWPKSLSFTWVLFCFLFLFILHVQIRFFFFLTLANKYNKYNK